MSSAVEDVARAIAESVRRNGWDVSLSITGSPTVMVRQRASNNPSFCALSCADHEQASRVIEMARGKQ